MLSTEQSLVTRLFDLYANFCLVNCYYNLQFTENKYEKKNYEQKNKYWLKLKKNIKENCF